ncbi:MAG: Membrane protein insertion efficiency factor YidD, partial [uncultured Acetobacteraceae bacterium]
DRRRFRRAARRGPRLPVDGAAGAGLQLPLPSFVQRLRARSAARPRRRPRRLAFGPARPPLQPLAPGRPRPGAAANAPAVRRGQRQARL